MTPFPGLDLLQRLLDEHRYDSTVPRLIPCLHDELEEDVDLLQAGAARYAGTLFDLSASDEDWENPPGPIVTSRMHYVQGVLASATPNALPDEVVFDDVDGEIIASLKATTKRPPEPSLKLILRAAAILASEALDQVEFTILCANTVATDPTRKELLWRLVTAPPGDLGLSGGKTIVPLLSGPVDPDIDYGREPAIRYVVRSDRVLKRSEHFDDGAIRNIANHQNPIVLFLGAGASASSGIPLGNGYRTLALKELLGPLGLGGSSLEESFFEYLHDRERFIPGETPNKADFLRGLTLERVLRETFHELGFRPRRSSPVIAEIIADCNRALSFTRAGRRAIRSLAGKMKGRLIIATVNFDQLIEEDLGTPSEVLFAPDHFRDNIGSVLSYMRGDKNAPVPILKLHGSVVDPESLIATIDTTSAGLHDDVRAALNTILEEADTPLTWVWIGCSMRDRDINAWLRGLRGDALDEWWVDPLPGESLDAFFNEFRYPIWRPRGRRLDDRLIVDSADRFLSRLEQYVLTK